MALNQLSRHSIDDAVILDIVAVFQETAVADDNPDLNVNELPEMDSDRNEEDSDDDVTELSALEHFTDQRAHNAAVAAERAQVKGRTRKKHYLGNSVQSQQRFCQMRQKLEARGFLSINDWFQVKGPSNVPDGITLAFQFRD